MSRKGRRRDGIGSDEEFLDAIDDTMRPFMEGDIVQGTIVKVDRNEVLLHIAYKTEGVIPSRELSIKHDIDPSEVVKVGDRVEAMVLQKEDQEGRLILSMKRAEYERAWGRIEQIEEDDGVVTGTVIEVVKDGLILDMGLHGFLPASLVEMRPVRDLHVYLGQTLEAKIIELDKNRNKVVLSRRARLEQTLFDEDSDAALVLNDLREQLADKAQERDELRKQLADKAQERDELRKQLADIEGQLDELRATADRYVREGNEARTIARGLWAAMPPEGRLAYFESGSSWLPEWIVGKEE